MDDIGSRPKVYSWCTRKVTSCGLGDKRLAGRPAYSRAVLGSVVFAANRAALLRSLLLPCLCAFVTDLALIGPVV